MAGTHLLADVALPVSVLLVVVCYFAGTFPSAHLAGRWRGVDPTASGSGNPGTTNVLRTAGRRAAVLTLVGDVLKAAVPAAVGWAVGGHGLGVACGVAALVGHILPVTRRFKGGKGVATILGMFLVLYPLAAVLGLVLFGVVCAVTRIAAVGSLAAVLVGVVTVVVIHEPLPEIVAVTLCVALIWFRHLDNIRRLVRGDEATTHLTSSG